jgi:hypothetical protein
MTAVSFSTIAQPNLGGVLFIEMPERVVRNLRARFNAFSFSHRREFVDWVRSAKRAETRLARTPNVVAQVRAKARAVSST